MKLFRSRESIESVRSSLNSCREGCFASSFGLLKATERNAEKIEALAEFLNVKFGYVEPTPSRCKAVPKEVKQ